MADEAYPCVPQSYTVIKEILETRNRTMWNIPFLPVSFIFSQFQYTVLVELKTHSHTNSTTENNPQQRDNSPRFFEWFSILLLDVLFL